MSEEEYDFIVGFTIFKPTGFKTMYRHFNNLITAEMFVSNKNLKDNSKIYVDLELYNKEKEIYQNTGKLVKNRIDGTIGVVLREWETGQVQVLEKIQPEVINTHDSWKTLELLEE